MSLLVDKYEPQTLSEVQIQHNEDVCNFLKAISKAKNMPHMIIQGNRGSGKKLLTHLFLKEKYGKFDTSNTKMYFKIQGKSEEKSTINLLASSYHYQFNPNNHNIYDRTLLKLFLNEITYSIISKIAYRIIIIEDADLLSTEAQESLRKTLETHINHCRFIFISNNEGKIIDPLKSRCAIVRVHAPTKPQIVSILTDIYHKETDKVEPNHTDAINSISESCERNIKMAINYLERYILEPEDFSVKKCNPTMIMCENIVNTIVKGSDIANTMDRVREIIYSLVNYCVEHKVILDYILQATLKKIPKQYHDEKYLICLKAAERDQSLRQSSKGIYHVEGFCLYIMIIIKAVMGIQKKKQTVVKKRIKPAKGKKSVKSAKA